MNRTILKWLNRGVSFIEHPSAMLLRRKGVISNFYILLDKPWIHDLNIETILDIGGNVGRFSKTMEYLFPNAHIYAFEPLPSCFKSMENLMGDYKNFEAFNIGLGNQNGELEMEESKHNPSSSLLPMADLHKNAFPFAEGGIKKKVEIKRLDDVFKDTELKPNILIKVDVQGYEKEVILGGIETFKKAKILLLELSFQELYKGQPLFDEIYEILRPLGFKFHGNLGLMNHPKTGVPLDADCVFINESIN